MVAMAETDTLPKLLLRNYKRYGSRKIAMRKKELGIWQEYTWSDCYERVKYLCLGLISLGLEPGHKVGILGDNDPQWYWAEFAAIAGGGVAFGIYADATSSEAKFLLQDSDARFVFAKDQEQVDKILEIRGDIQLLKVIYWDPKGLSGYDDSILISFERVIEIGKAYEANHPALFENRIQDAKPDDICILCYTSGTTGEHPKGVMLSHQALLEGDAKTVCATANFDDKWDYLSYISPAWITEQSIGIGMGQMIGLTVDFPEAPDTSQNDVREIGPHFLMFSSRLWESMASTIQAKIGDSSPLFRFSYNLFLPVGYKVARMQLAKQRPNLLWRVIAFIAHFMLFRPLRDKFGLLKLKTGLTGGATTSPDAFLFFRAIGVNLRQWYGFTEGGILTFHRDENIRFESVGPPGPGNEVRISNEGEILSRSVSLMSGYYKRPEATQKVLIDGWAHSGDAGYIDDDGHLIYYDRVKDMSVLSDGTKYAPQYIESRLKFSPYIRDVMVAGGEDRAYISALVNIDFENVGKWAERRRIPYTTFADLSQKHEVYDLIRRELERVNRTLPRLARVEKFACLHKEFDPDDAELTRSRKLRRAFVEDRYKDLIEAVYGGRSEFVVEAQVKYQDGRTGTTKTCIGIQSLGENK